MEFSKQPIEMMLKTLVYKLHFEDKIEYAAVGIRADREINSVKLANHFKALEVELDSEDEVKKVLKTEIGFIGPVGCPIPFVADNTCKPMHNFICGANEKDYHYKHVQWERDCPRPAFYDFCQAIAGDLCPFVPEGIYEEKRGIEVGHIFNLGDRYSQSLGAFYQTEDGKPQALLMGCYGIGVGRCVQAAVEQKYDAKGIIWPMEIAPFHLLLTPVNPKDQEQMEAVEKLYSQLQKMGIEVLLDDRNERLGFKLKDSDLIGIPFKMIIGKNFLSDQEIEVEPRQGEKRMLAYGSLNSWVEENLSVRSR